MRVILLALLALAFAGCTDEELSAETYDLAATGIPTEAVDDEFTFTLTVSGDLTETSNHIGAHFWNATQDDPTATIGDSTGCSHTAGDVPGTYEVTCDPDEGTWYLRGHVRIEGEETFNYWTEEFVITSN